MFFQYLVSVVGVRIVFAVGLVGNLKEGDDSGLQVIDDNGWFSDLNLLFFQIGFGSRLTAAKFTFVISLNKTNKKKRLIIAGYYKHRVLIFQND